jgi:hypothetical protein
VSRRPAGLLAGIALCAVPVALAGPAAAGRHHRIHRPPPPLRLWSSLGVTETEYAVTPSHLTLAAGLVRILVANRGMDGHDLTIADANGTSVAYAMVTASQNGRPGTATLVPRLPAGRYRLYCSLFDHESRGMLAYVDVVKP